MDLLVRPTCVPVSYLLCDFEANNLDQHILQNRDIIVIPEDCWRDSRGRDKACDTFNLVFTEVGWLGKLLGFVSNI